MKLKNYILGLSMLISSTSCSNYFLGETNLLHNKTLGKEITKEIISKLINKDTIPTIDYYSNTSKRLNKLNKEIIKLTQKRDSLKKIYNEIQKYNYSYNKINVKSNIPNEIKSLDSLTNQYVIGIDKSQQKLIVYSNENGNWIFENEYDASTGINLGNKTKHGDHKTPEGLFYIKEIQNSKNWLYQNKKAYGPWFMRLSGKWSSIGIHGTNEPEKLGKRASHGCIRVSNKSIDEIFSNYAIRGTAVLIDSAFEYETKVKLKPNIILNDDTYFQNNWKNMQKRHLKLEKQTNYNYNFRKESKDFQKNVD